MPIDRPSFAPGSLHISDPRKGSYFNISLFSAEQFGQLGNASRRFFSGPGLNNWDAALLKDTAIREGIRRIGKVVAEQVALYGTLTGEPAAKPPRRASAPPAPPKPEAESEGARVVHMRSRRAGEGRARRK